MKNSNNFLNEKYYIIDKDLKNLLYRLRTGMKLNGRIVDCLGKNRYLLRIWGYNIITESEHTFKQFDEIQLVVKKVDPHLTLDLLSAHRILRTGSCPQDAVHGQEERTHQLIMNKRGERTDMLIY